MSIQLNSFQVYLLKQINIVFPSAANIYLHSSSWLVNNLICTEDDISRWIAQLIQEKYIKEPEQKGPVLYNIIKELNGETTQQDYAITQKGRDFLAIKLAMDFGMPPVSTDAPKTTKSMTIAECALLHYYLGKYDSAKRINRTNMDSIAGQNLKSFSKTSGVHLYTEYEKFTDDSLRIRLNDVSKKSAGEHLRRFKTILPILEIRSEQAFKLATKEYKLLVEKFEDLYPM